MYRKIYTNHSKIYITALYKYLYNIILPLKLISKGNDTKNHSDLVVMQ